jgi:hypothetical protein
MASRAKAVSATVPGLTVLSPLRALKSLPNKRCFDLDTLAASSLSPDVMAMLQNAPADVEGFGI